MDTSKHALTGVADPQRRSLLRTGVMVTAGAVAGLPMAQARTHLLSTQALHVAVWSWTAASGDAVISGRLRAGWQPACATLSSCAAAVATEDRLQTARVNVMRVGAIASTRLLGFDGVAPVSGLRLSSLHSDGNVSDIEFDLARVRAMQTEVAAQRPALPVRNGAIVLRLQAGTEVSEVQLPGSVGVYLVAVSTSALPAPRGLRFVAQSGGEHHRRLHDPRDPGLSGLGYFLLAIDKVA